MKLDSIDEFIEYYSLQKVADRCSNALLKFLMDQHNIAPQGRIFDPSHIVHHGIRSLESPEWKQCSGMEGSTQFRHVPLKGLWKQHVPFRFAFENNFVRAVHRKFLPDNRPVSDEQLMDALQAGSSLEEATLSAQVDKDSQWAKDAIKKGMDRIRCSRVTGEWLVYAAHGDRNHYLCLATHRDESGESQDKKIRKFIDQHCLAQFPFLKQILVENKQTDDNDPIEMFDLLRSALPPH